MQTMQSWFGLKETHNDFSIENDADARLFFARHELNEQLLGILRRSFRTGNPPKLVLYGAWGVGKTHTMRHIEYVIQKQDDFPAQVVFVELPDITARSTFQVAHGALLDALSFDTAKMWVLQFQTRHATDAQQVIQETTQSGDIATAFANLLGFGEASRIAWDWLRGIGLTASDARLAGLPPSLSQSNQLVRVLQMFGTLCMEVTEHFLVFMLDETTKLGNVTNQDSINHWVNAFKLIADPATKEIGFIVSGSWLDPDDMAIPLNDEQVAGRFGEQNYIRLNNLSEEETAEFISSLVSEWVDPDLRTAVLGEHSAEAESEQVSAETFPFTWEGLQIAAAYACRHGGFTTPRDIQKTLDDLLNRAIDDNRHVLSSSYVNSLVNA
jgi:Cdc6-like AAA superfamily ATPase